MSRHSNRQNELAQWIKERLNSVFSRAIRSQSTHEEILNQLSVRVWDGRSRKKATGYTRAWARGYESALWDLLRRQYLVFAHEVGDQIITVDDKTELSPKQIHDGSTWKGFVWKDTKKKFD